MPQSFLLCPPDHFEIAYTINPYMDLDTPVDPDRAQEQWGSWKRALEQTGARVHVQTPVPGLPDIVFTNNAGFVVDGRALLTRFRNAERQPEAEHDRATFERLDIPVTELTPEVGSFEGAAEAVIFGETVVCSWGLRTGEDVPAQVAAFTGLDSVVVGLHDPRFYHLDVVLAPLDGRSAMIVGDALSRDDLAKLTALIPDPILLEAAEGEAFCANAVVVDQTVFMHHAPVRLARELEQRGFTVVEQPVGEFMKAGGAIKCMSLRLDQTTRTTAAV